MSDEVNKIQKNWETYEKLLRRLSDDNINKMLDDLGERLCMCPASTRLSEFNAEAGGLIQHSLDVTSAMRDLNDAASLGVKTASIIKAGLLHDIGKVGDIESDLFVDQDSSWHRDNLGQMYKYNESCQKMSVSHRTHYLLQHFGITLSRDEWIAIQLAGGSHFEENRFYVGSETTLGILLQQSKSIVIHKGKLS
jgi:putative nucleotidyltransferase with HDIG domain